MEWKPEYAIIFFLVLVGGLFQFARSKNVEGLSMIERLLSLFAATLFGGLIVIGVFLVWLEWHFIVSFGASIPAGIQAEQFLRLWLAYGQEAKGFKDFVGRMTEAYKMTKINSNQSDEQADVNQTK